MSYSSEIKEQLLNLEIKKECCRDNYNAGHALGKLTQKCDKDIGVFLRGVFIKCGFISKPGRDFMLSFTLANDEYAGYISGLLTDAGLPPKLTHRKGKTLLYYKKSEDIEDVLSLCGGVKAALGIISAKVMSDVRNNANRVVNAETANLDRMARAAAEQTEAIRKLDSLGMLQNLPPELRECALLRIQNPDMSLSELCNQLREPISRSGLNHRLRKLVEMAENI